MALIGVENFLININCGKMILSHNIKLYSMKKIKKQGYFVWNFVIFSPSSHKFLRLYMD